MYRLLTPVLAVIVAIALFTTFIRPTFEEYKRIDAEIADYDLALTKADELQQRIAELIADKNAISTNDSERLMSLLPDAVDEVDVVLSLDEIADRNRMIIEGISVTDGRAPEVVNDDAPEEEVGANSGFSDPTLDPMYDPTLDPAYDPSLAGDDSLGSAVGGSQSISTLKPSEFYETAELTFSVTGTYEDFKTFIRELEQNLVLMDISTLSIAPSAEEEDLSSYSVSVTMYQFKIPSN